MKTRHQLNHEMNKALVRSNAMLYRLWTLPSNFDGTRSSWHLCISQAMRQLELAIACRKEINQQRNRRHVVDFQNQPQPFETRRT